MTVECHCKTVDNDESQAFKNEKSNLTSYSIFKCLFVSFVMLLCTFHIGLTRLNNIQLCTRSHTTLLVTPIWGTFVNAVMASTVLHYWCNTPWIRNAQCRVRACVRALSPKLSCVYWEYLGISRLIIMHYSETDSLSVLGSAWREKGTTFNVYIGERFETKLCYNLDASQKRN